MKRFIDLRGQDTGSNFAWWDTITNKFEIHSGEQAWDKFEEFAYDYKGNDLERYRRLTPSWAFALEVDAKEVDPHA